MGDAIVHLNGHIPQDSETPRNAPNLIHVQLLIHVLSLTSQIPAFRKSDCHMPDPVLSGAGRKGHLVFKRSLDNCLKPCIPTVLVSLLS